MDLGSVNRLSPGAPVNNCRRASLKIMLLTGQERNYEQTKNFNKSLALAASSGPKLQAPGRKLQASSRKLDKKEL